MKENIINDCITRWKTNDVNDLKIMRFSNVCEEYVSSLSLEMKDVFIELLKGFDYYSHGNVNERLIELHNKIIMNDNVNFDNSVFTILKSQRCTMNSSYEYLFEYKNLNQISKYSIVPDINDCIEKEYIQNIECIILIDDFCGSGNTFIDYLNKYKEYIKNKKIIYVVIHIMDKAYDIINEYATRNNLDIIILYHNKKCAAFEMSDFLKMKRSVFKSESEKLNLNDDNIIFGFRGTESLIAFFNNTPNNTLGIFWKQTNKNNPLFPREKEEKPSWMKFKTERKQRNSSNYYKSLRKHE